MKVNKFITKVNTGYLINTGKIINIKSHKFYDEENKWHPFIYEQCKSFDKKYVYCLMFRNKSIIHISLNFFQNQKFLWLQDNNWLQKEENLRYIINILFLIIGCYIGYKQI